MKPETKRWNFIETNLIFYFRYEVISANFSMTKLLGMVRMPTVCGILKVEI